MEYVNEINRDRRKEIMETLKRKESLDEWGDVQFGNDKVAVDYNLCIDNSTEESIDCSAFYLMRIGSDGFWYTDTSNFVPYQIDFANQNWEEDLRLNAELAFLTLTMD